MTTPDVADVLATGAVELVGRMPYSSNATFLVEVAPPTGGPDAAPVRAIYKPERGERPLWDFPPGLWKREVAAYLLAQALGWDLVPVTISREDAPLGVGSLQHFVEADFAQHYFTMLELDELHPQLRRMCAFDLMANNTDRKGGHCLIDAHNHLWGIDNGLSFAAEFKVRTVIWDFADEPIPAELLIDVEGLLERGLPDALADLLDPFELDALRTRMRALLHDGIFPDDPTGHRHPWPLV